ncbi:MAG: CBS domain-containing protein [Ectothiorhodospiraceae bacterium]|jgi:CBS domain-containing protein
MRKAVGSILEAKGRRILALGAEASIADAVRLMNSHNVGAVLIFDPEERLEGIFTERDVLRRVVDARLDYENTPVERVMTRDVLAISPETTIEEALLTVSTKGCRHLPVVDGERVVGMISIRDLTNSLVEDREHQIAALTDYIAGQY